MNVMGNIDEAVRRGIAPGRSRPAGEGRLARIARAVRSTLRSMLGQMMLATLVFVGFGVYHLAIAPIMAIPSLGKPDPMTMTLAALNSRFYDAMLDRGDARAAMEAALDDPRVREVRRVNPGFRYYLVHDGVTLANGAPRYWQRWGLARLYAAQRSMPVSPMCATMQKPTDDERGSGYVNYGYCFGLKYVEFTGVRRPIAIPVATRSETYGHWLWSYSRNFLLPSLGVFLVLATILVINALRIRRVARLTRASGGDGPHRLLPEVGLPSEVTPLVQAINGMIVRAEDTQRRRRFFLSASAHEMRTPLTILRTRLESLADGALKTRLIDDLARLTTLANDLLTLTGIEERGRSFQRVDLVSCCLEVIGDLEDVALARDVSFRFRTAADAMMMSGDPALLKSAIANLVDNAVSFAPAGSEVSVTLDEGGCLAVRDCGPGIPSMDAETLFEPFVRAGSQRPGHGLGLAIVKAVADLHGATVQGGNAVGGGARFTMRFPRDAWVRSS